MTRMYILFLLCLGISCKSGPNRVKPEYTNYRFDKRVIDKIPVYESLVSAILTSFPSFQKHMNEGESYHYYHYIPSSDNADDIKRLPPGAEDISRIFNGLGKDFIYGFDVFKDSTVKIYVRSSYSGELQVDINENLSYYPAGKEIKHRVFPTKDTLLNSNWQYWITFD